MDIRYKKKLVTYARLRATKKELTFNITHEDITIPNFCPVLGIELIPNYGGAAQHDASPTLDRIKNEEGYVKGNVRVISNRANRLKSNGTVEDFKHIVEDLRRN